MTIRPGSTPSFLVLGGRAGGGPAGVGAKDVLAPQLLVLDIAPGKNGSALICYTVAEPKSGDDLGSDLPSNRHAMVVLPLATAGPERAGATDLKGDLLTAAAGMVGSKGGAKRGRASEESTMEALSACSAFLILGGACAAGGGNGGGASTARGGGSPGSSGLALCEDAYLMLIGPTSKLGGGGRVGVDAEELLLGGDEDEGRKRRPVAEGARTTWAPAFAANASPPPPTRSGADVRAMLQAFEGLKRETAATAREHEAALKRVEDAVRNALGPGMLKDALRDFRGGLEELREVARSDRDRGAGPGWERAVSNMVATADSVAGMRKDVSSMRTAVVDELTESVREAARLAQENAKLAAKLDSVQEVTIKLRADLEAATAAAREATSRAATLEARGDAAASRLKEANAMIADLQAQCSELRAKWEGAEATLKGVKNILR